GCQRLDDAAHQVNLGCVFRADLDNLHAFVGALVEYTLRNQLLNRLPNWRHADVEPDGQFFLRQSVAWPQVTRKYRLAQQFDDLLFLGTRRLCLFVGLSRHLTDISSITIIYNLPTIYTVTL